MPRIVSQIFGLVQGFALRRSKGRSTWRRTAALTRCLRSLGTIRLIAFRITGVPSIWNRRKRRQTRRGRCGIRSAPFGRWSGFSIKGGGCSERDGGRVEEAALVGVWNLTTPEHVLGGDLERDRLIDDIDNSPRTVDRRGKEVSTGGKRQIVHLDRHHP